MASSTTSPKSTASSAVAARAPPPISATSSFSESGPREFAIATSWPAPAKSRAVVPPMLPEPMIPIRTSGTLLPSVPVLREPVRQLLSHVGERLAGVLESVAHAVPVVRARGLRLLANGVLLAAPQVLAADDVVVVALAHPRQQLVHAPDGERVGEPQLEEQPREAVHPAALLRVLGRL